MQSSPGGSCGPGGFGGGHWAFALALGLFATFLAGRAVAEAPTKSALEQARKHYLAGTAHGDEGRFDEALAEYLAALELVPDRPSLQLAAAFAYEKIGRQVAPAVELYARYVSGAGSEGNPAELKHARQFISKHRSEVFRLTVTGKSGTRLFVDGKDRGTLPLGYELYLAPRLHRLEVSLDGHFPRPALKQIAATAGGEARFDAADILEEGEEGKGMLVVRSKVPEVQVEVDGKEAASAQALPTGEYTVTVQRPGYEPFERKVTVEPAAQVTVHADLVISPNLTSSDSGLLRLAIDQESAQVALDGSPAPRLALAGMRVPVGLHDVAVTREGYSPWRRRVEVVAGTELKVLTVRLWPSPETLAQYEASARSTRRWGWITTGAGVVVLASGAALLGINGSALTDAQDEQASICEEGGLSSSCDLTEKPSAGTVVAADWASRRDDAREELNTAEGRQLASYLLMGGGAVIAGVGAAMLMLGDDPDYYREGGASSGPEPVVQLRPWIVPGGLGLAVGF